MADARQARARGTHVRFDDAGVPSSMDTDHDRDARYRRELQHAPSHPDSPTTVARGGSRRARLPDTSRRRETDGSSSATRAAAAAELPTHTAAVEAAVRVLHLASGTPPPRTRRGTASTRAVGIPRLGATSTSWPDDNPSRPPPASTA